jgi:preprotein translocase subunit Sec63
MNSILSIVGSPFCVLKATDEEIKESYKKLCRFFHPDKVFEFIYNLFRVSNYVFMIAYR